MTLWKDDEPVHGHPSQGAHEEFPPYGIGAAYQHHLRVERSEMRLRVLHPCERHLGPSECVGDHRLQDRLRERRRKLPWWSERFRFIYVALSCVVAPPVAQLLIYATQLIISRLRRCEIRLHALLLSLRRCHCPCNPCIMPMTCCMVIYSLSACVVPCLVDLIICGFWNFF